MLMVLPNLEAAFGSSRSNMPPSPSHATICCRINDLVREAHGLRMSSREILEQRLPVNKIDSPGTRLVIFSAEVVDGVYKNGH